MLLRIFFCMLILSFLFQQQSYAIEYVIIESNLKQKVKLNINGKSVIKKVKIKVDSLEAVGSRGNKGAKYEVGGYCFKFGKQKSFYKKFKFYEAVNIFPFFENCYKNIESYNNYNDNILTEGYIFDTYYLSDKVNYLDWRQFSLKGLSKKLKNSNNQIKTLMYLNVRNNYTKSIIFIPTDLYEPNNFKAKEAIKSLELLLEKYDNSDLTESELKKNSFNTMLKLDTWINYYSAIMMIFEREGYLNNQNYIHYCLEQNSSMTGSFNQVEVGFILDESVIRNLSLIGDKFKKPLKEFEFDETLMSESFNSTIEEVFEGCDYSSSLGKLLIQSRN